MRLCQLSRSSLDALDDLRQGIFVLFDIGYSDIIDAGREVRQAAVLRLVFGGISRVATRLRFANLSVGQHKETLGIRSVEIGFELEKHPEVGGSRVGG
jgi:hypothetical protein